MTLGYIGKCSLPMHSAHSALYIGKARKLQSHCLSFLFGESTESREGTDLERRDEREERRWGTVNSVGKRVKKRKEGREESKGKTRRKKQCCGNVTIFYGSGSYF